MKEMAKLLIVLRRLWNNYFSTWGDRVFWLCEVLLILRGLGLI